MTSGSLLLIGGTAMAASLFAARSASRLWLAAVLAGVALTVAAVVPTLFSGRIWEWRSAFLVANERILLRLDGISAMFLCLIAVVSGAAAIYSREYWNDRDHPASAWRGRFWWSGLTLSMVLVVLVANGLHFLIAWELFTVCAYFLITLDRGRGEVRKAGWLYLGASHAGTLALFAFFSTLAARTGGWDLGPMRDRADLAPLFWLALFGFGLKAGMFPLHIWLPSAHANAPSHVSAIMSGVTIKMGIYALVRFSGWLPVPGAAAWTIALLGGTSAILGVVFALGQHDLKRLLAYHSVENIGIILMGLGAALLGGESRWGQLALAGALLHVWNHGLFKSLLFLGAGSVLHATGTREMSRLGGLWRSMPWTATLFGLGAVAICGLPPLNGFVSEFLIYLGLFDAVTSHGALALPAIGAAIGLAMTGALALACFIKVCGVVFLGAPRSEAAEHAHECGPLMRGPMVLLAGACLAIGLLPVLFWPVVSRGAAAWYRLPAIDEGNSPLRALTVAHVVVALLALAGVFLVRSRLRGSSMERSVTWDCGYAAPTPRMQYTAGSFAGIITGWFDWILLRERHEERPQGAFPSRAELREHTPETVLEKIVEPAGGVVMHLAGVARRFQHGRLQYYLLYLVAGVILLAVLAMTGNHP